MWETEKTRQRGRDTRRKERKRYKRWGEEASHPFQNIANNHRPYVTQDNIPNKQKFPDFWLAK